MDDVTKALFTSMGQEIDALAQELAQLREEVQALKQSRQAAKEDAHRRRALVASLLARPRRARRTGPGAICWACGRTLGPDRRPQAQYCNASCATEFHRREKRRLAAGKQSGHD